MICNRCIHKKICKIEYDIHNCADFFELVRCENCKYRKKPSLGNRRDYCEKHSTLEYTKYVNSTDYCSEGKRREIE